MHPPSASGKAAADLLEVSSPRAAFLPHPVVSPPALPDIASMA